MPFTGLTRRKFLVASFGAVPTRLFALNGAAALSILATTPSSRADGGISAALAIGGAIAGRIAAHNRRDMIGPMLQANYQLLRIALVQLGDLQIKLELALQRIADLGDRIEEELRRQDSRHAAHARERRRRGL